MRELSKVNLVGAAQPLKQLGSAAQKQTTQKLTQPLKFADKTQTQKQEAKQAQNQELKVVQDTMQDLRTEQRTEQRQDLRQEQRQEQRQDLRTEQRQDLRTEQRTEQRQDLRQEQRQNLVQVLRQEQRLDLLQKQGQGQKRKAKPKQMKFKRGKTSGSAFALPDLFYASKSERLYGKATAPSIRRKETREAISHYGFRLKTVEQLENKAPTQNKGKGLLTNFANKFSLKGNKVKIRTGGLGL